MHDRCQKDKILRHLLSAFWFVTLNLLIMIVLNLMRHVFWTSLDRDYRKEGHKPFPSCCRK